MVVGGFACAAGGESTMAPRAADDSGCDLVVIGLVFGDTVVYRQLLLVCDNCTKSLLFRGAADGAHAISYPKRNSLHKGR